MRPTRHLVFLQIFVGAVMRHTGAGLAIPDFPLVFGRLVPPAFDFPIAVHYAHRLGAGVVTIAVVLVIARALALGPGGGRLRALAVGLGGLVVIQISLGAAVVLTGKSVAPNTAHVATGASVLATTLLLTLTSWRVARESSAVRSSERLPSPPAAAQPDATGGV